MFDELSGYPHLTEVFKKAWFAYTRTCEMSTFAPVGILSEFDYELVQVDYEVKADREYYGLRDDYRYYDKRIVDDDVVEIWGHDGCWLDSEACLIYRNYDGKVEVYNDFEEEEGE